MAKSNNQLKQFKTLKQLTVGSLFTGIGGIDLGLENTGGFKVVWQSEINTFCNTVLKKHWPEVPNFGNIRAIINRGKIHLLPKVDVIAGGFPCQPVSLAGKQRGAADDRYFWPEMFAVIRHCQPEFVVVENVYGFVAHGGGVLLERTCTDLEGAGYEVAPPFVFPACSLQARHERARVWVVARKLTDNDEPGPDPHGKKVGFGAGRQRGSAVDAERDGDEARGERAESSANRNQQQIQQPDDQASTVSGRGKARQESSRGSQLLPPLYPPDNDRARRQEKRAVQPGPSWQHDQPPAERSPVIRDWYPVWPAEPGVGCVVHGVSPKLVEDELAALGNAVVPVCAELVGRLILASIGWGE